MKTIYLVVKVNKKSLKIEYVIGAFTEMKKAQGYCDQLNETIKNSTFIIQQTSLEAI